MGYFKELHAIRMAQKARDIGLSKNKEVIKVKYFDETDGLDASIVHILNLRLEEVKEKANRKISETVDECKNTFTRLKQYESLPSNMRFLVH